MVVVLEQFLEPLHRQAGVFDDTAHSKSIDWLRSRNDDDALAVGHGDVLTLAYNPKSGFLKCLDSAAM